MTREKALEELRRPAYNESTIAHDCEYVATKLGISMAELQSYMDAPNKSYRDYRSQRNVFAIGARALKGLGIEKAVKR
jgi:hypothetical protein